MTPISLGMVGGGEGAFIGNVHRIAARLDGAFTLTSGAFSSDAAKGAAFGAGLGIDTTRLYPDYATMARAEAKRRDGIKAVAIVTPNHMHAGPAIEFLKRGIHVICDKPLTATMAEAKRLAKVAQEAKALFILTHNYTAYPMIRQAREMIARGDLGTLRVVQVEYLQDWLAASVESQGSKQAEWRIDPARAGGGGAIGDIGTHGWNLAGFVTGQNPQSLSADLASFGAGRALDDHAHILTRYEGGMRGALLVSQVAVGHENGLRLRVYGDKGGIDWAQESPNQLWYTALGSPKQLLTRNGAGATAANQAASRIPAGHPEGYLEAFGTLYREAAEKIRAFGSASTGPALPGIDEGLAGMSFIAAALQSHKRNGAWVPL